MPTRSLASRLASCLPGLLLPLAAALAPTLLPAQSGSPSAPTGRVVLVLPFENRSGNPTLDWIGDSFPDTLDKRLNSAGFLTISHDDRVFALTHLGLPADFRPSRATTIRIAQQLDADFVIIGHYSVQPNPGNGAANDHIDIQSQVLSIDSLRLSPAVEDGADLDRLYDAENSIAWKIVRVIQPHFNVAEQTFLAAGGAVPLPAFEDYIRGINAPTPAEALQRLQAAVTVAPDYIAALLALGKQQYASRDFDDAAATLAKVPRSDPQALEANFYIGLARFNSADYADAASAFEFVASRLPLPEVVNDQAVALSRQGKDAVALFRRASDSDPSDEDYRYNLAISLYRQGNTTDALAEADAALKLRPGDNEAGELRAQISIAPPGSKLSANPDSSFSPVERIRRTYSETGFRQAAFQLDELRAARMAALPPSQRAAEYTDLGNDYLAQGLLPESEQQFQFALAADPRSAAAHAGLAQIRERSASTAEARSEAQQSLRLQPNAAAFLVLARLDLAANQLSASAGEVSQALRLEPSNPAAIAMRQSLIQRGQSVP
ncbi:MAG TPA: tetratricopeptide repeat protein [Acidobacteriaceae bacterium]|jgi:tetratricopeptide (TPR) repeat protein|nr:tetratricopeptide repeat protein [Acidobacteriaceae bacterium]